MTRLKQNYKYGYYLDEDGVKLPDAHEQRIICIVHELYWERNIALSRVAEFLNSQGYRTRDGSTWKPPYLQKIVNKRFPHPEHLARYKASKNQ